MNGGLQLPFPEDLPINRETLLHFAAAFLSGRLQSTLDARKAMVVSRPFSTHNTVRRNEKRPLEAEVRGVSERFKPKDAVVQARLTKSVDANKCISWIYYLCKIYIYIYIHTYTLQIDP